MVNWKRVRIGCKCCFRIIGIAVLVVLLLISFTILLKQPSNDRDWKDELALQSFADVSASEVTLYNIRNSTYDSDGRVALQYYNQSFNADEIVDVWFFVQPFGPWDKIAHTFLSFEFKNGEVVTLSIEIRAEVGESYSALKGVVREYESIYVWADEADIVLRRTVWLNDTIYMYRLNTSEGFGESFFLSLLEQTNSLTTDPQFYHSLFSSCTSSLVKHANTATPGTVSFFDHEKYFPGISDRFLFRNGFLDVEGEFPDFRAGADIRVKARSFDPSVDGDFSVYLRG